MWIRREFNDARECLLGRLDWNAPKDQWRYTTARTIAKECRVNTIKLAEVEAIMLELNGGLWIPLCEVGLYGQPNDTKRLYAPPWLKPVLQVQRRSEHNKKFKNQRHKK